MNNSTAHAQKGFARLYPWYYDIFGTEEADIDEISGVASTQRFDNDHDRLASS